MTYAIAAQVRTIRLGFRRSMTYVALPCSCGTTVSALSTEQLDAAMADHLSTHPTSGYCAYGLPI